MTRISHVGRPFRVGPLPRLTHRPTCELVGRDHEVAEIRRLLTGGQSVLLVGPAGIGKSALIRAVDDLQPRVVDPFERISTKHAAEIRRWLDRGERIIAAAATDDRRRLGAVGRVRWRFVHMRIRPLELRDMSELVARRLTRDIVREGEVGAISANDINNIVSREWIMAVARAANGRPDWGTAFARVAAARWQRAGQWPSPEFAIADGLCALSARLNTRA